MTPAELDAIEARAEDAIGCFDRGDADADPLAALANIAPLVAEIRRLQTPPEGLEAPEALASRLCPKPDFGVLHRACAAEGARARDDWWRPRLAAEREVRTKAEAEVARLRLLVETALGHIGDPEVTARIRAAKEQPR